MRAGQERGGVPWTPYLGIEQDGSVRVGPDWAVPSSWGEADPLEIVYQYQSSERQTLLARVWVEPESTTDDGVSITVSLNDKSLFRDVLTHAKALSFSGIQVNPGDIVEVALGPNSNSHGDASGLRITLLREGME